MGPLRYTLDFVRPPLHAVSFYFACTMRDHDQDVQTGSDPELGDDQLIRRVQWVGFDELGVLPVYPEGLDLWLPADAQAGFAATPRYIGTLR